MSVNYVKKMFVQAVQINVVYVCMFFCSVCWRDREDFFKNCEKCGKRACPDNYTGDGFCSKCSFTILSISELNDL